MTALRKPQTGPDKELVDAVWTEGKRLLVESGYTVRNAANYIGWLLKLSGHDYEGVMNTIQFARGAKQAGVLKGDVKGFMTHGYRGKPKATQRLIWARLAWEWRTWHRWSNGSPDPDSPRCVCPRDLLDMPMRELEKLAGIVRENTAPPPAKGAAP